MDTILVISLLNLGFFGGFTHCMSMCGPFVLTQVSNRLQNASVEEFSGLTKLSNFALFPYHFGRIFTYSLIGFLSASLSQNIRDFTGFKQFSAILMILAALFFLSKGFEFKVPLKKLSFLSFFRNFHLKLRFLEKLFQDPTGWSGFLLGVVLGFIPCGLLYGAFMVAASIQDPMKAAFGMALFGLSTMPALIFSALGGYFFLKIAKNHLKYIARLVILINSATLIIMAVILLMN